jgi:hypothetical protein
MLPCVGFNKLHVLVSFKFSNKLNVRLTKKVLDSEGEKVTIGVFTGHVSFDDADALVDVQAMDIPLEKYEQFATEVSRLDAIMVPKHLMESKQSVVVSSEFHYACVQVSKNTAPYSNASIDESLTLIQLLKFFPLMNSCLTSFSRVAILSIL